MASAFEEQFWRRIETQQAEAKVDSWLDLANDDGGAVQPTSRSSPPASPLTQLADAALRSSPARDGPHRQQPAFDLLVLDEAPIQQDQPPPLPYRPPESSPAALGSSGSYQATKRAMLQTEDERQP